MNFLLRLVGAFLAGCACVALAWVLGPAGLLLPAVVIVMGAFSGNNSNLESASIMYSIITLYLLISLIYVIVVTSSQYYLGEEQYELVRVYIDYQVFQPVFADKSFLEPEGLIHSENAVYDNLAYLTSHLGLFLLAFLGIFRFGEVKKALRDIDVKFDEAGEGTVYFVLLLILSVLCYKIYFIYFDDYSPHYSPSGKAWGFVASFLPLFLVLSVFLCTLLRRMFK
ncbi:hypothetical protein [Roseibium sp.]|uniref:hypothetical protein n=1 Tax=Roseibium sp. TaxID=1936156 RepID=UPI003BB12F7C